MANRGNGLVFFGFDVYDWEKIGKEVADIPLIPSEKRTVYKVKPDSE